MCLEEHAAIAQFPQSRGAFLAPRKQHATGTASRLLVLILVAWHEFNPPRHEQHCRCGSHRFLAPACIGSAEHQRNAVAVLRHPFHPLAGALSVWRVHPHAPEPRLFQPVVENGVFRRSRYRCFMVVRAGRVEVEGKPERIEHPRRRVPLNALVRRYRSGFSEHSAHVVAVT